MRKKAQVYLMKCGCFYKIGISANPKVRLRQLDQRPFKTELIAVSIPFTREFALQAESDLHGYCEQYKVGGEWFLLPKEIIESIKSAIEDEYMPSIYGEE